MEKSIYGFIFRYSGKHQILLLLLTLASFPFLYFSLDLPKKIVNDAIHGENFPRQILGITLDQVPYLMVLSGLFLVLVFINGGFKFWINVSKGRLGERMLRRLRYELYLRVLRFPLPHFRRMSQGEIIPMITAEVEPLGGFIGDAVAQPIVQGGSLLVYIFFIFMQDPVLGAAAVSLYPFQGWLIPRLQKRVNQLGKRRVRTVRQLSDRIGESVQGVEEIHAHDTSAYHLADFSNRLGDIYDIRFEIYNRKFFIKFLNNFINQLTPFFFYSIGGYLVIRGQLSFGALVAVLAAYKDLAAPWKELLDYYQQMQDIRIKYEQVVEQFQPPDLLPMERLTEDRVLDGPLPAQLSFSNVFYLEENGLTLLDSVSFAFDTGRHTAVIGGSGRDELMLLFGRQLTPSSGRIRLGEYDYTELPESVVGRRIAYVGPASHMFTDTLRANLYYGLKHRPLRPALHPDADSRGRRRRQVEARASGNTDFDIHADWIDYQAAGCSGPEELQARSLAVLEVVDMACDVYRMGLNGTIEPTEHPEIAERVMRARAAIRARLQQDRALSAVVELFDAERYNTSATVAENLLFGTPVGPTFAPEAISRHPYMLMVLDKAGLTEDFLTAGIKVAEMMIELFADLPPSHEFFEQFSFIGSEELPEYQQLLARVGKEGPRTLAPEDRARFMSLPFKLIPSRHRLGLMDAEMEQRLLAARRLFAADLPEALRGAVEFFDADRYNAAATLQDNMLFGKMRYGQAGTLDKVQALIAEVVDELRLRETVMAVGLDHWVGVAGARLSAAQRQKVGLARALLKRPDLLILNEATATLDCTSQARVHEAVRRFCAGRGLIWAMQHPAMARGFDEVIVLKGGRIAEHGRFADIDQPGSTLRALMAAE